MAVKITSATNNGLEGILIKVEVDICKGLPMFNIVGLPDASVKEARERVRAAIINSGYNFPLGRITINLAPADVKKIGSLLDLPIALGILMESNQIKNKDLSEYIVFGELSLFGELKGIKGMIPIILQGINENKNKFIFSYDNLEETYYFNDGNYFPFKTLKEAIDFITYEDLLPYKLQDEVFDEEEQNLDYGNIIGQYSSKRALEIAAAGNHNILMLEDIIMHRKTTGYRYHNIYYKGHIRFVCAFLVCIKVISYVNTPNTKERGINGIIRIYALSKSNCIWNNNRLWDSYSI